MLVAIDVSLGLLECITVHMQLSSAVGDDQQIPAVVCFLQSFVIIFGPVMVPTLFKMLFVLICY